MTAFVLAKTTCGHGCFCLTQCGDYYESNGLPKPAPIITNPWLAQRYTPEQPDLGWFALNYRTALTVHDAQAAWLELEQFVNDKLAAEREGCAVLCENIARKTYNMTNLREYGECADAIRNLQGARNER